MSTEDPFITGMRTNLNDFNAKAEQRVITARKAQRKRKVWRVVIAIVAATAGLGMGTIIANSTSADAIGQVAINKFIRANGGIAPCTEEDGSGQPGMCFYDDGDDAVVNVPTAPGKDKRTVILINR